MSLIAVIVKGQSSALRFEAAQKLLDYGFANFSNARIVKKDDILENIKIEKGNIDSVNVVAENNVDILCLKGQSKEITTQIQYDENISAPLAKGQKVGEINCYLEDRLVGKTNIVSSNDVKKKNVLDFLNELIDFEYTLGRTSDIL